VAEPIIPLRLFRNRTIALASLASVFVGSALYGITVFLSQYFQISRLKSPAVSGVFTIPLIVGMFLTSLIVGRIITRTGRWRIFLIGGSISLAVGLGILAFTRSDTPYPVLAVGMLLAGAGMGATMQNLVLAVQNSVRMHDMGSATATVSFLRSLGGAIGVSALGAVLANQVSAHISSGLAGLGINASAAGAKGAVPSPATLPVPVGHVVEHAYGIGTAWAFGISAAAALIGALVIPFIREVPLRTTNDEGLGDELQTASITVAAAEGVAENDELFETAGLSARR
jgi:MFS family permease